VVARRFYTPAEAAQQLGVSSTTVMSLIHSGRLPAVRISERIYRIPIPAFERLVSGESPPNLQASWQEVDGLDLFGESGERTALAGNAVRDRAPGRRRAIARP
jgi:excisionase family DNA binding protein